MLRNVLVATALIAAALSAQTPVSGKNDYANGANWLCKPGRSDACNVDLTSTVIAANGTLSRESWKLNPNAPIDCFYVYPTVSKDSTANSDMIPGPEETDVVLNQFARFASQCRPYAPMYRQVTLTALMKMMNGTPAPANPLLAYADVRDAWNYYLEHDNNGRGVVLIGHSQGATVLLQLIRNEIDGKPVQARMVSAMLMGTAVVVPRGKDVGGSFQSIPLCHAETQTGCVITYASFRADVPPPANTKFGRVATPGMIAGCVNPAALGGGSGELQSYFSTGVGAAAASLFATPSRWLNSPQQITTPFVSLPGLLTAECVSSDAGTYLAISVHGNPGGPRTNKLGGDVIVGGQVQADWGLHLIDMNEAMGNLVAIAGAQGKAFAAKGK